jgi:hypothetical protein
MLTANTYRFIKEISSTMVLPDHLVDPAPARRSNYTTASTVMRSNREERAIAPTFQRRDKINKS